jgi:hypothetical protein
VSRLFPASAGQTLAWRDALRALWRNPDRTETARSTALNDRQDDLMQPLGRVQRAWHFQVALTEHGRQQTRERRAARTQGRHRRGR